MDLKDRIGQLDAQYSPYLQPHAWRSETDRWAELVFSILLQCSAPDAQAARSATTTLQRLNLLGTASLTSAEDRSQEVYYVLAHVLRQHGFSESAVAEASRGLADVARIICRDYGGKIQRYLRHFGLQMRDALIEAIDGKVLSKTQLTNALSLWLQNVLNLPISLQSDAVSAFCRDNAVSAEELWRAADELDLNVAVVDDLIEMAHQANSQGLDAEMGDQEVNTK